MVVLAHHASLPGNVPNVTPEQAWILAATALLLAAGVWLFMAKAERPKRRS